MDSHPVVIISQSLNHHCQCHFGWLVNRLPGSLTPKITKPSLEMIVFVHFFVITCMLKAPSAPVWISCVTFTAVTVSYHVVVLHILQWSMHSSSQIWTQIHILLLCRKKDDWNVAFLKTHFVLTVHKISGFVTGINLIFLQVKCIMMVLLLLHIGAAPVGSPILLSEWSQSVQALWAPCRVSVRFERGSATHVTPK